MTIASPFVVLENCKLELEFYKNILGGELKILKQHEDHVLIAELHFGSTKITFADTIAAQTSMKGDYVQIVLILESEDEFLKVYEGLAEEGRINVEKCEAPFNGWLANVTDRNGNRWVLQYYRKV